ANKISAKPGHSEHQTGYTVDCNSINPSFIETPEGQWLDQHCHEYGFIIRYPEGKEAITGYEYECWHIRYVGVEMATEIYEQGLTLEEYLDVLDVESHLDEENETSPEDSEKSTEEAQSESEEDSTEEETEQATFQDDVQIMDAPLEAP
ncbi:MAG: M15 family metallopeptidase, partial [Oscillospiraceae bacterium]|nr:M15 family metallopeptidase [Oscillospiraceae bacterium]